MKRSTYQRLMSTPCIAAAKSVLFALTLPAFVLLLNACSSGGSSDSESGTAPGTGNCTGQCADANAFLTVEDVQAVIARGVAEARAQGAAHYTIAVVDRVGNVLAVFKKGAQPVLIASATDEAGNSAINAGLEGIRLDDGLDVLAAISKAVTGAYLSSEGNAFSTRTASQIVQQHFNPGEENQPGGPLFGVQFSQLACSDFTRNFNNVGVDAGPKRSPLGLSADPGGFPLYKNGTPVGGVGVIADERYGLDLEISDDDSSVDESIAFAATFNFAAPVDRRGDRITADGKSLHFSNVGFDDLAAKPASAAPFSSLTVEDGALVAVTGYTDNTIKAGLAFSTVQSGIRADSENNFPGQDAFVFVDENNALRFPPIASTDGGLTADQSRTLLMEGLKVANRARAQIRRPVGSQARVTISVVDTNGVILGMARTRDAPIFGADVSLQKARSAMLMSSSTTADFIKALPPARYVVTSPTPAIRDSVALGSYVDATRIFFSSNIMLSNGVAFAERSIGNLARPFYPDGLLGSQPGPLSKPVGEWSPFSTGLQLDLVINAILQHVLFTAGAVPDVAKNCAGVDISGDLSAVTDSTQNKRIANGLQIFAGGMPIYSGTTLIGAIGVSGDGIDQDDMIAFLGLHNAGIALGGAINNAPDYMRADTLEPKDVRLRYVQCPQAPFIDSDDDNVCEGK
jgi:uncharacterized protein GlcG (DUF336 family)